MSHTTRDAAEVELHHPANLKARCRFSPALRRNCRCPGRDLSHDRAMCLPGDAPARSRDGAPRRRPCPAPDRRLVARPGVRSAALPAALHRHPRGDPRGQPAPGRPPAVHPDPRGRPRNRSQHGARRVRAAHDRGLPGVAGGRGDAGRLHQGPGARTPRAGRAAQRDRSVDPRAAARDPLAVGAGVHVGRLSAGPAGSGALPARAVGETARAPRPQSAPGNPDLQRHRRARHPAKRHRRQSRRGPRRAMRVRPGGGVRRRAGRARSGRANGDGPGRPGLDRGSRLRRRAAPR